MTEHTDEPAPLYTVQRCEHDADVEYLATTVERARGHILSRHAREIARLRAMQDQEPKDYTRYYGTATPEQAASDSVGWIVERIIPDAPWPDTWPDHALFFSAQGDPCTQDEAGGHVPR